MSIAVIGSGYWGKNLVRNFYELGELRMVCDSTEAGRATARSIAADIPVVADIDSVLSSKASAVAIATPAVTHYEVAKRALLAGKDVFVEKPLALTYQQGSELVELAYNNDRILMVGHVLEYHPAIVRLRELITEGELGKIRYVYSNRLSLGKVRHEENALWSLAPHDIAILLRIVGQSPSRVSATGGSYVTPNIADATITNLLFDNGVRGHIFVSWLHPFKEQRLVVIGDRKMASFEDVGKKLVLYDHHVDLLDGQAVTLKGEVTEIEFAASEPLRLECEAFLRAIETRDPPLTDGVSGLEVLRVLQAAQRSLETNGEPVSLSALGAAVLAQPARNA